MSRWKIFYTNGTSLNSDDARILDDPRNIPIANRVGVHSVIQEMEGGTVREVIEQYHYLYLISEGQWLGVGLDGLLDYLVSDFDNISCILHGRTTTTDSFFALKKTIREDTDVIGGILAAQNAKWTNMWHRLPPYSLPVRLPGTTADIHPPWRHTSGMDKRTGLPYEDWTAMTRHRQYAPEYSEPGPYGEQREH